MSDFFKALGDWLGYGWYIGEWHCTVGMLLTATLVALVALLLRWLIVRSGRGFLANHREHLEARHLRSLRRIINLLVATVAVIGILKALGLDLVLYDNFVETPNDSGGMNTRRLIIRLSSLLLVVVVFKMVRLVDWFLTRILFERYYNRKMLASQQDVAEEANHASKVIQYLLYLVGGVLVLRAFGWDYRIAKLGEGGFLTIANLLEAAIIMGVAWLLVWILTKIILQKYYRQQGVDVGNQFAINQLLKYVIFIFAFVFVLQNVFHANLTLLLGGAAALLVGVGLGLQQTFNDLISGIILLFERTIEVGDVVRVDGLVGTVKSIGIRTSIVELWDNTSVVVPNSKFITEKVMNWTYNEEKHVRFHVAVGVAYDSDTELVRQLLLLVAEENPDVLQRPAPFVRFVDFADSSLNFELHFWSRNFIRIEDVKSDLRFEIDGMFRRKNVEIPFPQRVVWTKKTRGESEGGAA